MERWLRKSAGSRRSWSQSNCRRQVVVFRFLQRSRLRDGVGAPFPSDRGASPDAGSGTCGDHDAARSAGGAFGAIATQNMAPPGILVATWAQVATPVATYAMTPPGAAVVAPAYAGTVMQLSAPAPMYITTVPHVVGPSRMFDPMFKLLGGSGGDFGGVLQALAELRWSVKSIRDALNALSKVYKEYR